MRSIAFLLLTLALGAHAEELKYEMVPGGGGLSLLVASNQRADAPSLLFIHGFITSLAFWDRQLTSDLAERFNVTAVDMRGHGGSEKPLAAEHYLGTQLWADDVHAALEKSGAEKSVVVTYSYGSYFLLDYIRHYGADRIAGIVFVSSTSGFAPKPQQPLTPERKQQIARSTSPRAQTLTQWNQDFLRLIMGEGEISDDDFDRLTVASMMTPHYVRPYNRQHRTDNTDLLDQLEVPVLFVSGAKDRFANHAEMRDLAGRLPDGKFVLMEDAGNMPFWFQPSRFNQLVSDFVATVDARD